MGVFGFICRSVTRKEPVQFAGGLSIHPARVM